jgi:predicted DNA-binding transcriptional regulator AlpA
MRLSMPIRESEREWAPRKQGGGTFVLLPYRRSRRRRFQVSHSTRMVSEAQAAEIIGYSKDTLRREFRAGRAPARVRLSARRIGYRLSTIYAFLEARSENAGTSA